MNTKPDYDALSVIRGHALLWRERFGTVNTSSALISCGIAMLEQEIGADGVRKVIDKTLGDAADWMTVNTAPPNVWMRTKRDGEAGENICALRVWPDGDREWVEKASGRTTITHGSFAAPTHWRSL